MSINKMICLGIESTAHTFSIGIITETGELLSLVSDIFIPDEGGLTPAQVVEHHYQCYNTVLLSALSQAKLSFSDVNLIAFSQGPGIGAVLRIGAIVARTLSLKLNIPLVGVNHCIAHVEIGKLMCKIKDPITLYVSGGNTIISAYQSKHYQIFGETLDISIGNMLDKVARLLGIPHPGGPRIEKIAAQGKNYISIPYIVKGMNLSFSGLFSFVRKKLMEIDQKSKKNKNFNKSNAIDDLIYSLQETSFSMLTEVCERALAHTEKQDVLLTGGVAANKRLQDMIEEICKEHNVNFHVVPRKLSGDNGAMIAWNGILRYNANGGIKNIKDSLINPKWRMDEVPIPWLEQNENKIDSKKDSENGNIIVDEEIITYLVQNEIIPKENKAQIIRRGAEASLIRAKIWDREVLLKFRHKKKYRPKEVDEVIRAKRTQSEGKALISLQKAGIPTPPIYQIYPNHAIIIMKYIEGKRIKDIVDIYNDQVLGEIFYNIGVNIAKIHQTNRVHGDITTSNILINENMDLFFIDLGLTEYSQNIENFSVDLHLFKRVLVSTHGDKFVLLYDNFIKGYRDEINESAPKLDAEAIILNIDEIELRGRYIKKEHRST